jgi:hypothetical protein
LSLDSTGCRYHSECFLIEREPLCGDREILLGVDLVAGLQPIAKTLLPLLFDIVQDRPVDDV